jgi:C_GCAxxG_C_C family probable redox protein
VAGRPAPVPEPQELARLVGEKAAGLFAAGAMLCAPAALVALNQGLGGPLERRQAQAVASALPEGMGGAGCTCGALAGAQMGLGLFTGGAGVRWRRLAPRARALHDAFRAEFGSTCCRVLSKKVAHDPRLHLEHCLGLTGYAARRAAALALEARPELAARADAAWLSRPESRVACALRRLAGVA